MARESRDLEPVQRNPQDMADRSGQPDLRDANDLSPEELAEQESSELPDREAMSLVNANVAAPINAAIAANVLSDNSTAQAVAIQDAPITQHN